MKNFIVGTMLALMCGGVVGCSDRVEFKWNNSRGTPSIAGFVDDSLVVAYDCREWLETTETWNGAYSEDVSCGHDRLLVYNYRVQEDGPRWTDSLTNERGGYRWYQLTDSIFWRWNGDNILLWKLGETAHEIKISRKNDGCSEPSKIDRMHQWLDGKFIALGKNLSSSGDSCQYAVLDTAKNTLIYKQFDEDLKWVEKCDDVRAWGEDVYCVILDNENGNSVVLKNEMDTISSPKKFYIGGFWGNIIKMNGSICSVKNDVISCSDVTWRGNEIKFYRNDEVVVEY